MSEQGEKWCRMQDGPRIPWSVAEQVYAKYVELHGNIQSLEEIDRRGGFGWAEVAFMFRHPLSRDIARVAEAIEAERVRTNALEAELEQLRPRAALATRLATQVVVKHTSMGHGESYKSLCNGGDFDPYSTEELEDVLYDWLADYDALEPSQGDVPPTE